MTSTTFVAQVVAKAPPAADSESQALIGKGEGAKDPTAAIMD